MGSLWSLLTWLFSHGANTNINSGSRARLGQINVPSYRQGSNEDSIDLQIKSLFYVFHRLQLNNLSPFLVWDEDEETYKLDYYENNDDNGNNGILMNSKLDKIYNIEGFREQLILDPHRVLVDWSKNKARSMFVLSGESKLMSIPSLPALNFKFIVLKSNSEDEEYIDKLVNQSGFYAEHRVSCKIKTQFALDTLKRQRKKCNGKEFSMDDRSEIINGYLKRLAVHVQVHRLYNATLRSNERERVKNMSDTIGNYKSMTKNSSGYSISNNNGDCSDTTTSSAISHLFTNAEKTLWWDQSKMAVRLRVERERYAI